MVVEGSLRPMDGTLKIKMYFKNFKFGGVGKTMSLLSAAEMAIFGKLS